MWNPVKSLNRMLLKRREKLRNLAFRVEALETALKCQLAPQAYNPAAAFNGQDFRKQIFHDLLPVLPVEAIIETGTYIGNTTGYLAQHSQWPVQTCESHDIFHLVAKQRLASIPNIHFVLGDSRSFLNDLAVSKISRAKTFFYLDAHWHKDLPLAREIAVIAQHWQNFVIMIDDFQVPADEDYGYDKYGRGKTLCMDDFADVFASQQLQAFFPTLPGREETGSKRGCVVLAKQGLTSERIAALKSLKPYVG